MKMWQVITLAVLILTINSQSQTLSVYQNISAGTNAAYDRVRAVDFSDDGTKLLTVYGSLIKIWTLSGGNWVSSNNVTAPEGLEDTRFNNDGSSIVALANNSNSAYVFNSSGGNSYSLAQTLTFGAKPVSVGWALNSNFTIFGGADGSIRVYTKTNGNWGPYQIIPGAHAGSVVGLGSRLSRIVTCGSGDSVVKVWYYNLTTGVYTLQETDTISSSTSGCTALHYSTNQRRYAVGYTNGNIYIRERNNTYNYTGSQQVNAGSLSIYNLRFSQDGSKLISASGDNNLYLFFRDPNGNWNTNSNNNYSNTFPYSVDFNNNSWLAVGTVNTTTGLTNIDQVVATNCGNDGNSTGSNNSNSTCACNSGYTYIQGYCQQVNCNPSVQNNSAGTNSSATACNCNTGYKWSTVTTSCVRDCSTIGNSTGSNYDDATCYCNSGYTWGGTSCIVYVNCRGLQNSPGTNRDSSTCNCNVSYAYNTTTATCVLDCSSVANSNGYNTTNSSQCNCSAGYKHNDTFWGNGGAVCLRECNVSNLVRGNDYNDATKCRCYSSFVWDNSSGNGTCTLDCSKVNYSESAERSNGSCKCQSKYRWDKVIWKCTSKTGTSAAVAIACGVAIPCGIIAILALLGLLLYYCLRSSPPPPVVTPVYMQPAPVVTTTTTEVVEKVVPAQQVVSSTSRIVGPPVVNSRVVGPVYTSTVPRGTIAGPPLPVSGLGVGGIRGPLPPPSAFPGRF